MHEDRAFFDWLIVASGTVLSLFTSEKTLIFVTIVLAVIRIYFLLRGKNKP